MGSEMCIRDSNNTDSEPESLPGLGGSADGSDAERDRSVDRYPPQSDAESESSAKRPRLQSSSVGSEPVRELAPGTPPIPISAGGRSDSEVERLEYVPPSAPPRPLIPSSGRGDLRYTPFSTHPSAYPGSGDRTGFEMDSCNYYMTPKQYCEEDDVSIVAPSSGEDSSDESFTIDDAAAQ